MDGTGEATKPSPKDLGLVGSAKDKAPKEENGKRDRLIEEALQAGKSKIFSWVGAGGDTGYPGWQYVSESEQSDKKEPKINIERETRDEIRKHFAEEEVRRLPDRGIREFVVVKPLEVDLTEDVTVKVPHRKLFRTVYEDKTEQKVTGKRPLAMNEVGGTTGEAACVINYHATDHDARQSQYWAWRRPGNRLTVELILPMGVAKQISAEVRDDPAFIRDLTEAFVKSKYPKDYQEANWEKWGKPPYDKWDEHPDSSVCLIDLTDPQAQTRIVKVKPQ